jgi:hypothetical protein
MGIERIMTNSIKLAVDEKGPNGERVWKLNNDEDRIRFVGSGWVNESDVNGQMPLSATVNDYVEITFYGTGLNMLMLVDATARDFRASLDGSEGVSNVFITGSSVLNSRSYKHNVPINLYTSQTLGTHTVKVRLASGANLRVDGFEVLNESSSIRLPQGEIVSNGKKEVVGTTTTTTYNSGFDGSPTLNGRGGRVVKYIKDGRIGKVIQQTNDVSAVYPNANHTNEEVIRKINFREFGANSAAAILTTSSGDAAFVLDDGSTGLNADDVAAIVYNNLSGMTPFGAAGDQFTITFTGTGIDVVTDSDATVTNNHEFYIDGVLQSTLTSQASFTGIVKLASGLPYGTHTLKINRTSATANHTAYSDFIIYGPKKPAIPDGAIEIGEYYLVADYTFTSTNAFDAKSKGVISKGGQREFAYVGTWSIVAAPADPGGEQFNTATNGNTVEYTFFGTGVNIIARDDGTANTVTVQVDGVNYTGAATPIGSGTTTWTPGTSTWAFTGAGPGSKLSITGLSLGLHKVKVTKASGTGLRFFGMDIITPIHYPNTKRGSLALKPAASFPKQTEAGSVDLSKAKAWIVWDGGSSPTIKASYNISGLLRNGVGLFTVFFEKPFKNNRYVVCYGGARGDMYIGQAAADETQMRPASLSFATATVAGTTIDAELGTLIFFGELADEGDE